MIIECVPNFSDGRRPAVLRAILAAITSSGPVQVLDSSSDPDHNRSVVTFVGTPEAIEQAAFAAIRAAAQLIDLDQHQGQHPRIGAADVVPFIPLRGAKMEDCIAIARRLGRRVGDELHLPVYLYEAAATRPERENLEQVRQGEYEGLRTAIKSDPARAPDFGPSELGKAGAVAIGARLPLIAFNVFLTTDDVSIAKRIARAVRHSSGGLRYVKALGMLVENRAQVSLNLTNFEKTPVHRVVEMIRREADRYGVRIASTELIGLIPDDSLIEAARWYMQLDAFDPNQLLDRRLNNVPGLASAEVPTSGPALSSPSPTLLAEPPIPEGATMVAQVTTATVLSSSSPQGAYGAGRFVETVAQGTPIPGGGPCSALAGALAAALGEMVARVTVGKRRYADAEAEMQLAAARAESLRRTLLDLVDRDGQAYSAVMNAYQIDKSNPNRDRLIQTALRGATEVPLEVMRATLDALRVIRVVVDRGSASASIDGAVGAHLGMAALEGAALNVRANTQPLTDGDTANRLRMTATALLTEGRGLAAEIQSIAETRAGLR